MILKLHYQKNAGLSRGLVDWKRQPRTGLPLFLATRSCRLFREIQDSNKPYFSIIVCRCIFVGPANFANSD